MLVIWSVPASRIRALRREADDCLRAVVRGLAPAGIGRPARSPIFVVVRIFGGSVLRPRFCAVVLYSSRQIFFLVDPFLAAGNEGVLPLLVVLRDRALGGRLVAL